MRGASNPARWGTLHSVLPLHWEKPGADCGFLLVPRAPSSSRVRRPPLRYEGRVEPGPMGHSALGTASTFGETRRGLRVSPPSPSLVRNSAGPRLSGLSRQLQQSSASRAPHFGGARLRGISRLSTPLASTATRVTG